MVNKLNFILLLSCLFFPFLLSGQTSGTKLKDNFDSLPDDEKVQVLSDLCWQNREKNTLLAIQYGEEGIGIAKVQGLDSELSKLYNYMGVIYQHYIGEANKAILYYNDALNLALQSKDSVEIGYVYNNLGDAFYLIGNVPLAAEYAEKSMNIFEALNYKQGIAYSYINMGLMSRINRDYKEALDYFKDAIDLRKTYNDSVGIASATLEIGRTYFAMDKIKEAMLYFSKSLELHKRIDNKNYMAYSIKGIGDVYFHESRYDSALSCYQQALELDAERGNETNLIDNQLGIAMVYATKGMEPEGEKLLEKSLHEAKETGLTKNILAVYKTRAEFYHRLDEFRKASENYQSYIAVYDSLFSELQFQTMEEIKNRFEITERLNKINEDLTTTKKERLYFFSLIFLLLIIAIVLVLRYRIKLKLSRKLEASNRSKDKVFSIISHDLKNPFNGLIGFSELLLQNLEEKNFEEAKEIGQLILKTSTDSYGLITNLLNWAQAQRDSITPDPEVFNLTDMTTEMASMLSNLANVKHISINVLIEEEMMVYADENLTRTVLFNLLNNAVKFTNQDGIIKLSAVRDGSKVIVSVKDNGIGISKEKVSELFTENTMVSTPGTNNEKGTGLGLLVCKEFVEKNNGEIWVESEEGQGSTFYFTLPGGLE